MLKNAVFISGRQHLRMLALAHLLVACAEADTGAPVIRPPGPSPDAASDASEENDAGAEPVVLASDIPVAHTPPGGYGDRFPAPVLARCTEPLVEDAPDLRGLWKTLRAERDGEAVPDGAPIYSHIQRIEQCGDRLVVTAGGVVHDMRVDGTKENGVNDVAEADFTTRINVVATYEDGVHVLRPVGLPIEVTRRLQDGKLVWSYLGTLVTLERIGAPTDAPP